MQKTQPAYFSQYRSLKLTRDAQGVLVVEFHSNGRPLLANVIVAGEGATFGDLPHFAGGIVPGDGVFTTWSYRAGAATETSVV